MRDLTNRTFLGNRMLMASIGCALALAIAAPAAHADDQEATQGRSKSKTTHDTVTVTAIDKTARALTVTNEAGDTRYIQVPAEVKAFDKLKKGDKIDVDYTESVAISMLPPGSKPSMSEKSAMVRTGEGKGAVGKKISVSAEILDVDAANNKVTFKGPKGNARVVNVEDPEMQAKLPSLKPGQVVQFTYTEATAVAIQPKK